MENTINTITVKDFILSDTELSELNTRTAKKRRARTPKISKSYHAILESGCDFVVESYDPATDKREQLIILVSRNQYYIQKSDGVRQKLNKQSLHKFLEDLGTDRISLPQVNWLSYLTDSPDFCELLKLAEQNSDLQQLMKKGYLAYKPNYCFPRNLWAEMGIRQSEYKRVEREVMESLGIPGQIPADCGSGPWGNYVQYNENFDHLWDRSLMNKMEYRFDIPRFFLTLYRSSPQLYTGLIDQLAAYHSCSRHDLFEKYILVPNTREQAMLESFYSFLLIKVRFGPEWAGKAIKAYLDNGMGCVLPFPYMEKLLYNSQELYYAKESAYALLKPARQFRAESFLEYLFHGCVQQGFADTPEDFLYFWDNTLVFQEYLYGKIREKYPKNLASYKHKLLYLARKKCEKIQKQIWDNAAKRMLPYEYEGENYRIICPKSTTDLANEAANQHNCLLTYQQAVLTGNKMIFFLRENTHPQDSLVTIEICMNRIIQAKQRFNDPPTVKQLKFLEEWAQEKNLDYQNNAFDAFYIPDGNFGIDELPFD